MGIPRWKNADISFSCNMHQVPIWSSAYTHTHSSLGGFLHLHSNEHKLSIWRRWGGYIHGRTQFTVHIAALSSKEMNQGFLHKTYLMSQYWVLCKFHIRPAWMSLLPFTVFLHFVANTRRWSPWASVMYLGVEEQRTLKMFNSEMQKLLKAS